MFCLNGPMCFDNNIDVYLRPMSVKSLLESVIDTYLCVAMFLEINCCLWLVPTRHLFFLCLFQVSIFEYLRNWLLVKEWFCRMGEW